MSDLDVTSESPAVFRAFPASVRAQHESDESAGPEAPFDVSPDRVVEREGLPKSYRPRHDAHYVEQLAATSERPVRLVPIARIDAAGLPGEHDVADLTKSIAALGVLQPLLVRPHNGRFRLIAGRRRLVAARAVGVVDVPCLVHPVGDERATALAHADNLRSDAASATTLALAGPEPDEAMDGQSAATLVQLQDTLAGLRACLPLMARPAAGTREHVALKLLAVETEHAAWLVRARQYLAAAVPVVHTPIGGAALVDQVRRLVAPVIELRGGTLQIDVARGAVMLHGDRALLSTALVGLTLAVFALGESIQDPRVHLRLTGTAGTPTSVLAVTQPSAVLGEAALSRLLDTAWAERPGGPVAALAVRLARRTATAHRARLDAASSAATGTTIALTFGG